MNIFDLSEAANFLKMNPEVLRRKARAGQVPGRKAGKRWIFVKEHLADWVSGRYSEPRRELQVIDKSKPEDKKLCQSTSARKHGGFNTPHQTDAEYNKLLGLK
ncbi:MAG: helix-turn-helix domain-containing protein [bacterium]|nr:helix-turn-helix domain-containing protein [bacterium]